MSAETDIAAIDDGGAATAAEARAALTSVLGTVPPHFRYLVERVGTSAHADDAEFAADPTGTQVTPTGTATWTVDTAFSQLSCVFDTTAAGDLAAYLLPLTPTSAPVTIEASMTAYGRNNQKYVGVVFTDGVTAGSTCVAGYLYRNDGLSDSLLINSGTLTAATTNKGIASFGPLPAGRILIRLVWTAANTWKVAASPSGASGSWTGGGIGAVSVTMTPTYFGVFAAANSGTSPGVGVFDFVRVTESDLSA